MGRHSTLEQMMADRNQSEPDSSKKSAPRVDQGTSRDSGRDDALEKNAQPDIERSTASRPRGHTEEPDKTL
jgi:hypothetical protein